MVLCSAATWNVGKFGLPFALAVGPYGAILALTWQRDTPEQRSYVVWLNERQGVLFSQAHRDVIWGHFTLPPSVRHFLISLHTCSRCKVGGSTKGCGAGDSGSVWPLHMPPKSPLLSGGA